MFEEILLEKLASHFDDEDLERLAMEAALEAEKTAGDKLSDNDAAALAEYLGEDEMSSLINEVEAEKTAAAYYEMGEVMAQGFHDALVKLSSEEEKEEEEKEEGKKEKKKDEKEEMKEEEKKASDSDIYRALAVLTDAGLFGKQAVSMEAVGRLAKMKGKGYLKALKDLPGSVKEWAAKSLEAARAGRVPKALQTAEQRLALGRGAAEAAKAGRKARQSAYALRGPAGVLAAGGAGVAAGRASKQEKKSSNAEVYQALAVLAEAGLLED